MDHPLEEIIHKKLLGESGKYGIYLKSIGKAKLQIIKLVKEFTDLGLREAKELVDQAPTVIIKNLSRDTAYYYMDELQENGAYVNICIPEENICIPNKEEICDPIYTINDFKFN